MSLIIVSFCPLAAFPSSGTLRIFFRLCLKTNYICIIMLNIINAADVFDISLWDKIKRWSRKFVFWLVNFDRPSTADLRIIANHNTAKVIHHHFFLCFQTLFVAHGPAFKKGEVVDHFLSTELYGMMAGNLLFVFKHLDVLKRQAKANSPYQGYLTRVRSKLFVCSNVVWRVFGCHFLNSFDLWSR